MRHSPGIVASGLDASFSAPQAANMRTLSALAPAKINLTLRVVGRRPDGYHELESLIAIVQAPAANGAAAETQAAAALCDRLTVAEHEDGCYSLACSDPKLPCDGSNLVLVAARALARAAGVNHGAEISLEKRIPAGAGLGGGSSDAATTLKLLNELWQVGFSDERLAEVGAEVGSDVPLFFHGPLCVIRGRGERVERVSAGFSAWAVVLLPELHCATPAVYRAWDQQLAAPHAQEGAGGRLSVAEIVHTLTAPGRGMELLYNDLESAALEVCPELCELHTRAEQTARGPVRMTGSGAALFRLFAQRSAAAEFAAKAGAACGARTEVVQLGSER